MFHVDGYQSRPVHTKHGCWKGLHKKTLSSLISAVVTCVILVGCGSSTPGSVNAPSEHYSLPRAESACPVARDGHGSMGICAPKQHLGLTIPRAPAVSAPTYADLSNNDPCYCGAAIRRAGHVGLIVKMNQGTGFIDSTAARMVNSARRARLAVGGYDFDERYTVGEARIFVLRLHAAGIYPSSRNTFPAIFDVEYGAFSLNGLRAQIRYVRSLGYRVGIYTGGWYWGSHAGCVWVGLPAWLAGYPSAPRFCGLPSWLYHDHQFTERGHVAGAQYGDLSLHFGSSFAAYVNHLPTPKPKRHPKHKPHKLTRHQRELRSLIHERERTRRHLLHAHCRVKHPRRACRSLFVHGAQVNQRIHVLGVR